MSRFKKVMPKQGLVLLAFSLFAAIFTAAAPVQSAPAVGTNSAAKVDVNSADTKTLQTLPGVGPTTAKKIIAGRPYKALADFGKASSLSTNKLNALKDKIVFGAATAASAVATPAATPASPKAQTSTPPATSGSSATTAKTASSPAPTSSGLTPGQKININTASAADLDKLPGIGSVKAQAIVDYRTQNGNFKSIEDIQKVKGIKSGTFAKIKDSITVGD